MFGRWFNAGNCDSGSKGYSNKKHGWDKGHSKKLDFGKCFDKKKFSWDRSEDKKIDCGFNKSKHHDRDHSDHGSNKCDLWGSTKHHKCWDKKFDCSKLSFASCKEDKPEDTGCGEDGACAVEDNPLASGPPVDSEPCDCEPEEEDKAEVPAPKTPVYETCDKFEFSGHRAKKSYFERDHKDACDFDFSWDCDFGFKAPKIDLWGCDEIVLPKCEAPQIETKCWSFDLTECFSFC